jgi:hypothetical protein
MDFDAQGVALAARFSAANCPAPAGGYQAIRYASNYPPAAVTVLPCVLVLPSEGELQSGNGKRESGAEWRVLFFYAQVGTPEKNYKALGKWLGVLVDATKASVQLGGTVETALVTGWSVKTLTWGDVEYDGIELGVHIEAHESWLATA